MLSNLSLYGWTVLIVCGATIGLVAVVGIVIWDTNRGRREDDSWDDDGVAAGPAQEVPGVAETEP